MKPFFSVVIPTYNQANFLNDCLNSVFNQTFKNFEVIVIDNHSNDDTSKVIRKFYKRIIYKKIKNNGVIGKSRNLGIKISRGKWISFLDSDDSWHKDKLATTYRVIKKSILDVICNSEWIIKKNNITLLSYGPYKKNFYESLITTGNKLCTSASSVKRSFLKRNKIMFNEDKRFITSEDYNLFLDIAEKKGRFNFINKPLGYHFQHKKSASANYSKHMQSTKAVLRFHLKNSPSFTKTKKKQLWKKAEEWYFIKKKLDFIRFEKNKITAINNLNSIMLGKPIQVTIFILKIYFKKIKDIYFYAINIKNFN